jgi:hypothetical protein
MRYGLDEKRDCLFCCTPLNEIWQPTQILQPRKIGARPTNLESNEPPGGQDFPSRYFFQFRSDVKASVGISPVASFRN